MRTNRLVHAIVLAAFPLLGPAALAATTVTPIRSDQTVMANLASSTAYYPVSPLTAAGDGTYFLDVGDSSMPERVFDVTIGQGELASGGDNMLRFSFSSDKAVTVPEGGQSVLAITVSGTAGLKLVPIASITGSSNCSNCQGVFSVASTNYYLAARYTSGVPMQIGLYPADICYIYNQQSGAGSANGCTSGNVVDTASTATAMTLSFYVTTVTNATDAPVATSLGAADVALSLRFEATAPTLTCPSMADIYFPGDTQIYLNSGNFGISGVAPIGKLIVAGNESPSAAVATSAFASANAVAQRVGLSPNEGVSGFTNTTDGTDHQHNLAFMARDAAGIVATGSGACTLSGVQTADVQGFLKQSGCFIATAAFRSADAAPVEMLREFRDQVLLRSAPGQAFVEAYYRWSPAAAEWLMEHPVFRFPVLLALVPVQVIAWLFLHPAWLAVLTLGNLVVLLRGLRRETAH